MAIQIAGMQQLLELYPRLYNHVHGNVAIPRVLQHILCKSAMRSDLPSWLSASKNQNLLGHLEGNRVL